MRAARSFPIHVILAAAGAAAVTLLSGCGTDAPAAAHHPSGMHTMADGSVMTHAQMKAMDDPASTRPSSGSQPSSIARLVCGDEIADAVQHTYELASRPTGSSSWSPRSRLFTCRYPLAHSVLTLQVKDLDDRHRGRAYFERRGVALGAHRIRGLQDLGFPAFENAEGQVGFLKDGKTLYVDGSAVTKADLPAASGRTETAYGVAAAVIACWKE